MEIKEQLDTLSKKLDDTLEAAHAAQTKADEVGNNYKDTDSTVQKALEECTKAASDYGELKTQVESLAKTAEYVEKSISRMNAAGGGDESENKELEAKAREEMIGYLRKKTPISNDVAEATIKSLINKSLHGVPDSVRENEVKALLAGSNPDGGYFIRPERAAKMIQRIFETSPIRTIADVQTTNSDALELIIDDDEVASGGWVGETSSRSETGTSKIGKLTIPAHEQFAQPKATQKMLDDAGFDVEAWLSGKVTRKMTRVENTAFVVGDGSQKPRGFLSLPAWATPGTYERGALEQIASGTSGQFNADTIKEIQNSLIEDYQSNAIWGLKRSSWTDIITLKDGNGQYLLDPRSMKIGDSLVMLGKRVIFMEDMPAKGADALALTYGDFSVGYTIVDRMGFRVIRDNVTDKPNILFYTTKRTGGDVTNYEAIKIYKLSAAL